MIFGRVERFKHAVRIHLSSGSVTIKVVIMRRNVHALPDHILIDEARIVLGRESADIFGDEVTVNGDFPLHWANRADLSEEAITETRKENQERPFR
jgi:hypothetical protein